MANYTFSKRAVAALDEIYTYTVNRYGVRQADRYLAQLTQCFANLASGLLRGTEYLTTDGISYLRYPCKRHYVFYQQQADGSIYIELIIHQARNFAEHL